MASSISNLQATVNGMSANVTILAAAYVSGGQAVAMAGWALDVNNHATSLTLITSSGPVTVSTSCLVAATSSRQTSWRGLPAGASGTMAVRSSRTSRCAAR